MSLSFFGDLRGPIRESVRPFRGAGTAAVFSFQGVLEGRPCLFLGICQGVSEALSSGVVDSRSTQMYSVLYFYTTG